MSGSDLVRIFPYPVLQEGNLSFPQGKYSPKVEMSADGCSATVWHVLNGAPLITRLIEEKRAACACSVSIPITSYRRVHRSEDTEQRIEWNKDIVGEPAILHPVVVCLERLQCDLSSDDGVGEAWFGRNVIFEAGAKIALGSFFRTSSSLQSLLSVIRDPELKSGRLFVELGSEDGFYFTVHVAADLHDFLQRWGGEERRLHRNSIFTHVVSRCLELLAKEYGKEEGDGEEGWRCHKNLVALASDLENRGLPIWDDDSFVPEKVATALQPHVVPKVEGDPA